MKRIILPAVLLVLLIGGYVYLLQDVDRLADESSPLAEQDLSRYTTEAVTEYDIPNPVPEVTDYRDLEAKEAILTPIVSGLDAPWAFTWLPNGDILVTERFGNVRRVLPDTAVSVAITGVPEVFSAGQGGLLDVTTHPNFAENNFVYLSYAHGTNEANRLRVARAELVEDTLRNVEVIFETQEVKSGSQHFGSRFAWLPDGTLLFSVGDGGNPPVEYAGGLIREQAQNLAAHLGKIIRINDDGSIPENNPFIGRPDVAPEIYSYGHRNVQGIAYDGANDQVLASEHGSKGGDELSLVLPGANYGWPLATFATEYDAFSSEISPDQTLPGVRNPLAVWTPTIAPSSVVAYSGGRYGLGDDAFNDIFVAGMLLRSNTTIAAYATSPAGAIFHLTTDDAGTVVDQKYITVGDVRVRSIAEGLDGYLYVLTDATGRQSRAGENGGVIYRVDSF